MKIEDAKAGLRVRSHSDGFTNGWIGRVVEQLWHPSHPPAVLVAWDNGIETAVAVDLVEPEVVH